jgi:hypothetical protein
VITEPVLRSSEGGGAVEEMSVVDDGSEGRVDESKRSGVRKDDSFLS